ncbi:UNVERIFIED_CONTAM: hypothetical protein GTU68_008213 [Idotea baltica]|nr:hypothetical protein [Idotea baltica]
MDIQRPILIVALAAVSYMMVLKWNQDYEQTPLASSDIPNATNQNKDVESTPTNTALSANLIHVKTDVLDLAIDLNGGDITELTLPQYPRQQDHPNIPFQLFDNGKERLYLAQSGLIGNMSPDQSNGRALWSSKSTSYQLADGAKKLIVDLTYNASDKQSQKKPGCINPASYKISVRYLIQNKSEKNWAGNMFAQLKRDDSSDPSKTTATSTATYLGAAMSTPDSSYQKVSMKDIDKKPIKETVKGGWVAWLQHYFVTAWIPDQKNSNTITTRKDKQGNYIVGYTSPIVNIPAGQSGEVGATLYAGPKIQKYLGTLAPGLELTVDYGILWFIAQPIFWLLQHIHNILGNWGWSIIVLTMILKMAFFPLSATSYRSMARMRAVAPKLASLKEKYGDDKQKMSQSMMELYKKEKINPLGGCLPIVIQMPVFLALYWVLLESVEMRQAPWILWITDLSIKDPFFILPIIMGTTMFIQQRLNPTPPDPMQAKVMKLMPIIFTFFFLWFPAGLVIYWIVNNCLSISQQWYITRKIGRANKSS